MCKRDQCFSSEEHKGVRAGKCALPFQDRREKVLLLALTDCWWRLWRRDSHAGAVLGILFPVVAGRANGVVGCGTVGRSSQPCFLANSIAVNQRREVTGNSRLNSGSHIQKIK